MTFLKKIAAAAMIGPWRLSPDLVFELAGYQARLAGAARSGSGYTADQARGEADIALALLKQAVASGYRDADRVRTAPYLDPIRARPEFPLLLLDLAFPDDPFAH